MVTTYDLFQCTLCLTLFNSGQCQRHNNVYIRSFCTNGMLVVGGDTGDDKDRRNMRQKESRLRNVKLLGGSCNICGTTDKLDIHHSWYVSEDAGTHSNHNAMRELIEKEPERFALLCHRCNVFVGHVHTSMNDGTYSNLLDEANKLMEGRKSHSGEIFTAGHALKREVKCVACANMIVVRGRHRKKFCSKECRNKNRRKASKKQRQRQSPAILDCAVCSKPFQITTGKHTTCSPECRRRQRNLQEKEAQLRIINRLGGQCRICNTKENLEVNHRWYVDEDRATRSKHTFIEKLVDAQPERFSCLCHMCNVIVGHVCTSMMEGTHTKAEAEALKMREARKNNPQSTLIAYSCVPKKPIQCAACSNVLVVRGRHGKRFCSVECKSEYYQRPDMKAQRRENNRAYHRRLNPPKVLNCIECKKEFEQTTGGQISCSKECADKRTRRLKSLYARERRLPKFHTCDICGDRFQRIDGGRTCSVECRKHLENRRRQAQYKRQKDLRDANAVHLTCEACGKTFRKKPGPTASACSDTCKGELRRRKYSEKHPSILASCSICGGKFQKRGPHKTCSPKCHGVHVQRYHIVYNTKLKLKRH